MSVAVTIYRYSAMLQKKYGQKVMKIPVNLPLSCPNRDGTCGEGGCIFCAPVGTGFESKDSQMPIKEQIAKNIAYIGPKYHAKKYIIYFQNFTNTYTTLSNLQDMLSSCLDFDGVVGVCLATRPDCVSHEIIHLLQSFKTDNPHLDITLELGLQSVNYHTLKKINRGHTLAELIDASLHAKAAGLSLCAHVILNLPYDTDDDAIECAKILSALQYDLVKVHSLYIIQNTPLGALYLQNKIKLITQEEYIRRACLFLSHLSPGITVERLLARAPKEETLFCNWQSNWRKIDEKIEEEMRKNNLYQGINCDYLDGSAWRKRFLDK